MVGERAAVALNPSSTELERDVKELDEKLKKSQAEKSVASREAADKDAKLKETKVKKKVLVKKIGQLRKLVKMQKQKMIKEGILVEELEEKGESDAPMEESTAARRGVGCTAHEGRHQDWKPLRPSSGRSATRATPKTSSTPSCTRPWWRACWRTALESLSRCVRAAHLQSSAV